VIADFNLSREEGPEGEADVMAAFTEAIALVEADIATLDAGGTPTSPLPPVPVPDDPNRPATIEDARRIILGE